MQEKEQSSEKKDTFPYCGGCGRIYYNVPKLTAEEAKKRAQYMCSDCIKEVENMRQDH